MARSPFHDKDNITLYCGDNCEVMLEMPPASVDLVVTSPPYDDLRTYGGHSWDFYGVAWNLKRLLKPGGVIVWVVNDATVDGSETGTSADQAKHFRKIGLKQHDTMIWQKESFSNPFPNRYHQVFEYMFVFSLGTPVAFNPIIDRKNIHAGSLVSSTVREADGSVSARCPKLIADNGKRWNIWSVTVQKQSGPDAHPAPFPEALARDHIISWSNEGDTVLDPFSGSGTTIKMARELGRKGIGIEVNPEYCEIAKTRLEQRLLFQ